MSTASPSPASADAQTITQKSRSNLAMAFVSLPKRGRQDMAVFYAFCRVVDDIADEETTAAERRREQLHQWRQVVLGALPPQDDLQREVMELIERRALNREHFAGIIDGVEMDLVPRRFETFADLREYCYRVASLVGLVSVEIFECKDPKRIEYAVDLGLALQITNILRDVAVDWRNGERLYLPLEDLRRFGVSEADIASGQHGEAFLELMEFEAKRADAFFESSAKALPPAERSNLVAAEIMRAVYCRVLKRLRRGGFRVFEKSHGLSKLEKICVVLGYCLKNRLGLTRKSC